MFFLSCAVVQKAHTAGNNNHMPVGVHAASLAARTPTVSVSSSSTSDRRGWLPFARVTSLGRRLLALHLTLVGRGGLRPVQRILAAWPDDCEAPSSVFFSSPFTLT